MVSNQVFRKEKNELKIGFVTLQHLVALTPTPENPKKVNFGSITLISTWNYTTFLLPYDVGQYYNKENSVLFPLALQCTNNIQQTLHSDISARRQGLCQATTSLSIYINTQYLGLISILGMTPTLQRWKRGTWSTRGIEWRQVSQAIIPDIHSQSEQCSQGPNPPALPYPTQTGVLAVNKLDYHDRHVC